MSSHKSWYWIITVGLRAGHGLIQFDFKENRPESKFWVFSKWSRGVKISSWNRVWFGSTLFGSRGSIQHLKNKFIALY